MKDPAAFSIRIYRRLARAFPEEFQLACGNALMQTTEELINDVARREGFRGLIVLMARILADLAVRVPAEHARELWADARYAFRMLAASPVFTIAAIVSVGCGIGMSTSVFSQLDSFVFRPVPAIANSPELVALQNPVSFPAFEAIRDDSGQFSEAAAYMGPVPIALNDSHPPIRIWGQFVTPNYFEMLGVHTVLGRPFAVEETKRGIPPVAVVSEKLWRQQLGGTPDLVGRTVRLNGHPVAIIGVAAVDFHGASPMMSAADIWLPVTVEAAFAPELGDGVLEDRKKSVFSFIGRLRPGVDASAAQATIDTIIKQIADVRQDDPAARGRLAVLIPGGRRLPIRDKDLPAVVALPSILVGLMLWIACSNVGTMLLARSHARRREIAIRLSLGASRGRLIRQLLTECVILAVLGGAGGFCFAIWMQRWSANSMKDFAPSFVNFDTILDWKALAFTFVLSLVSGVLFGLAPAWQATRTDLTQSLKKGSTWAISGFRWFGTRNMLVLQQVAGSLTLLLITGFIVLGVQRTTSIDPGFDPRNLYMMSVDPLRDGYSDATTEEWFKGIRERVRRIPGVIDASLAYNAPVGPRSANSIVRLKTDMDWVSAAVRATQVEQVGVGYFETTGLPILHGRTFKDRDAGEARIIVNETMARQAWPDRDPIGQDVELDKHYEVIGVARNVNSGGVFAVPVPGVYELMTPDNYQRPSRQGMTLLIRGAAGVDVMTAISRDIAATDPGLTIFNLSSAQKEIDQTLYLTRATMFIYGGIGVFGLILAAVGLGGVTAYAVVQRTKEIGIRLALGATRFDVMRLVTKEGFMLVIAGTVIGQAVAYGITRALGSWFNAIAEITKTSTNDPLLLLGAPVLLASLTFIACYLPARQSTRIDPSTALREE
jgi:putative ABC transport system permease protein